MIWRYCFVGKLVSQFWAKARQSPPGICRTFSARRGQKLRPGTSMKAEATVSNPSGAKSSWLKQSLLAFATYMFRSLFSWKKTFIFKLLKTSIWRGRTKAFPIKTSQCTESLYGWLYIIKLNRPFFRRVKGMNLRVRRSEQKKVLCWERPLTFGLGLLWKLRGSEDGLMINETSTDK